MEFRRIAALIYKRNLKWRKVGQGPRALLGQSLARRRPTLSLAAHHGPVITRDPHPPRTCPPPPRP